MIDPASLDEMVDGGGGIRPHWRTIFATFAELKLQGLGERAAYLDQVFEERGSINPSSTAEPQFRRCDPVPFPLPAEEFVGIEAGLIQRAQLLQLVLTDIYGEQKLLTKGHIPPALIYPNPAFLRARRERTVSPAGKTAQNTPLLNFYAADLVRGLDGAWRVLQDHVTRFSGIGYAQENRRLLTHVMPEAFRALQVQQLRSFFDVWRDTLQRLALHSSASPGIALMTPGANHPDWFEHMLLARELSCALVEGGDLTVRNGGVFLKTLRGLQPIDVLVSRIPGHMLDGLELSSGSPYGVTGLMDSLRHGALRIVNDPGADILETPALSAFLPSLAPILLDEKLELEQIPVQWLGDAENVARVKEEPDGWKIVRFNRRNTAHPDVTEITDQVRREPWDYAAVAAVPSSVAPSFVGAELVPRPVVMRLYLAHNGVEWQAMPGGVAHVLPENTLPSRSFVFGALVKDVWVLDKEQHDILGPPATVHLPLAIRRTTGDLPGRIAENFFWLGRYLERLEGGARLVRTTLTRLNRDTASARDLAAIGVLSDCLAQAGLVSGESASGMGSDSLTPALLASVRDRGAFVNMVGHVTRLTEVLRDRLTADMYGVFVHTLGEAMTVMRKIEMEPGWRSLDQLSHAMIAIMRFTATVSGLAAENMVQGGGRLFLDLGRRVERAQRVSGTIAAVLDTASQPGQHGVNDDWLRLVLELCDSAITYRSRYLTVLQPGPVLDLVIADDGNPRGVAFQLNAIHQLLDDVVGTTESGLVAACEALLEDAGAVAKKLGSEMDAAMAGSVSDSLRVIEAGVGMLSDSITRRYFALLPLVQALGTGVSSVQFRGAA